MLTSRLNYFNRTTFGDAKHSLFERAGCLILPSHFENSPVVLKEAIAAKMAIFSSNIEANENVLQNRENYISFQTGSAEGLAQRMIELFSNQERLTEMCETSARIKNYDVVVADKKLTQMFNDLVQ